jgi:LysM domain
MGKSIISLLLLAAAWLPGIGAADEVQLSENAPDRYVVVKGDTLWDISGRFLKDPWRWPDVWGLNKDEIKNPHWIYPGDVVILDFTGRTPRLRREGDMAGGTGSGDGHSGEWNLVTTKLSPAIRKTELAALAIPTVSMKTIGPFLSQALVVGERELEAAPILVASQENRVVLFKDDVAFTKGIVWEDGSEWNIFRPGRSLVDPDTKEFLGREAVHLGNGRISEFGEVSTVTISKAVQEIAPGDRLVKAPPISALPFVPRSPGGNINAKIIASSDNSVSEVGPQSVVVLNRGTREGLEVGHVLALYRDRPSVNPAGATDKAERIKLPQERYGVVLVFRVFEKVSYALVMDTTRPVNMFDIARTP